MFLQNGVVQEFLLCVFKWEFSEQWEKVHSILSALFPAVYNFLISPVLGFRSQSWYMSISWLPRSLLVWSRRSCQNKTKTCVFDKLLSTWKLRKQVNKVQLLWLYSVLSHNARSWSSLWSSILLVHSFNTLLFWKVPQTLHCLAHFRFGKKPTWIKKTVS